MEENRNNTKTIVTVVAVIAVVLGLLFIGNSVKNRFFSKSPQEQQTQDVEDVSIELPDGWGEVKLTASDQKAAIIARRERSNPNASLIIRKIVGQLDENFDIKTLPEALVATFSTELKGFTLVDKEVKKFGGFETAQVHYKQTTKGETFENLIVVMPTANQTFYLTFRASEDDFAEAQDDFDTIVTDFADFVKT